MKQIWKPEQSITLTLVATYVSAAALLVMMFVARPVIEYLLSIPPAQARNLAIIFYACCPAAWLAIGVLLKLLHNIRAGEVFTAQNITLLRVLSWCFWLVMLVSFAAWRFPSLIIIGIASGFLGLILRVVKNVIARATILREENDLTI
jgi:hypothetical protein